MQRNEQMHSRLQLFKELNTRGFGITPNGISSPDCKKIFTEVLSGSPCNERSIVRCITRNSRLATNATFQLTNHNIYYPSTDNEPTSMLHDT